MGNATVGGDLSGTLPNPTVAKLNGITAPASSPTGSGQVLTSTSTSASAWQTPATNQQTVVSKTSSYILTTSDEVVLANASGGALTLTLPSAAGNTNLYDLKKTDASVNTVTIATTGGQTIDGSSSAVIKVQYVSISVVSDGSNWYII